MIRDDQHTEESCKFSSKNVDFCGSKNVGFPFKHKLLKSVNCIFRHLLGSLGFDPFFCICWLLLFLHKHNLPKQLFFLKGVFFQAVCVVYLQGA